MTCPTNPCAASAARLDHRAPAGATQLRCGSGDSHLLQLVPCCGGSAFRVTVLDPRSADPCEAVIATSAEHLWAIAQRPETFFTRPLASYGVAALTPERARELAYRSRLARNGLAVQPPSSQSKHVGTRTLSSKAIPRPLPKLATLLDPDVDTYVL